MKKSIQGLYGKVHIYRDKHVMLRSLFDKQDVVLDVGFCGQGIGIGDPNWIHDIIKLHAGDVFGIDINPKIHSLPLDRYSYEIRNAEDFDYQKRFSVIFSGDLIEHLSNPGKFLDSAWLSLLDDGRLIISTPNAFNLFNIIEKIFRLEPTVNNEHTCYFNVKTIQELLSRHGFEVVSIGFLKKLGLVHRESLAKKLQNILYEIFSVFTPKFLETLVIIAKKTN